MFQFVAVDNSLLKLVRIKMKYRFITPALNKISFFSLYVPITSDECLISFVLGQPSYEEHEISKIYKFTNFCTLLNSYPSPAWSVRYESNALTT